MTFLIYGLKTQNILAHSHLPISISLVEGPTSKLFFRKGRLCCANSFCELSHLLQFQEIAINSRKFLI